MEKETLTTNEAAELLGVARTSLINWIAKGKIPTALTPGGHRRFKKADLITFAASHGLPIALSHADINKSSDKKSQLKRVLIVDDDDSFRIFASESLSVAGAFEVKEACNGIEAALVTGSWKPDIILLDLNMPKMNGYEFIEEISSNKDFNNVKILILSSFTDESTHKELSKYNVSEIITKPIGIKDFVNCIRKITK